MKYVKLIAKPNTWFKEGTEAYNYYCNEDNKYRVTIDEWNQMLSDGCYCVRGTRISESVYENVIPGEEYFDGECGFPDEFEWSIVDSIN